MCGVVFERLDGVSDQNVVGFRMVFERRRSLLEDVRRLGVVAVFRFDFVVRHFVVAVYCFAAGHCFVPGVLMCS